MEGSTLDRALWVALAITAGVAAGTAAAVTASAFPYAFGAAFSALRSKRKKEHREHRSHRYKSDKTKRSSSKPKEDQAYRDAIRRSLLEWKDIDVSLESFPYFLKYIHILLALWVLFQHVYLAQSHLHLSAFACFPCYLAWLGGAVRIQKQHCWIPCTFFSNDQNSPSIQMS